jgi:cholesterol transport system auxiliary component
MMKMKNYLLLLTLLLSGCSLFSPVNTQPPATYVLNAVPHLLNKQVGRSGTLMVLPPDTRPIYDTTQIAYSTKQYQISFFGENRWAETPSQMLQPLLVQTLLNTHRYHAVVTPPYAGRYSYVLRTHILTLQQDFTHSPHTVNWVVRADIFNAATNQIIASKQFVVSEPIRQLTPYAGVLAANRATEKLLTQLMRFCLANS